MGGGLVDFIDKLGQIYFGTAAGGAGNDIHALPVKTESTQDLLGNSNLLHRVAG